MSEPAHQVTQLLADWTNGDRAALDRLTPLVYAELRRLAAGYLRQERAGHTLQPTALVHEAYIRLIDQANPDWKNRSHFFAVAAQLMRQILVDHARLHRAVKRDGGRKVPLSDTMAVIKGRNTDLIELDDALRELEGIDPRKTRIVELRFFAGLTVEETAQAMEVSIATVHRELKVAETWLYRRLNPQTA
jgi:RNA polymerase sigma factor (TIGR02999 family)